MRRVVPRQRPAPRQVKRMRLRSLIRRRPWPGVRRCPRRARTHPPTHSRPRLGRLSRPVWHRRRSGLSRIGRKTLKWRSYNSRLRLCASPKRCLPRSPGCLRRVHSIRCCRRRRDNPPWRSGFSRLRPPAHSSKPPAPHRPGIPRPPQFSRRFSRGHSRPPPTERETCGNRRLSRVAGKLRNWPSECGWFPRADRWKRPPRTSPIHPRSPSQRRRVRAPPLPWTARFRNRPAGRRRLRLSRSSARVAIPRKRARPSLLPSKRGKATRWSGPGNPRRPCQRRGKPAPGAQPDCRRTRPMRRQCAWPTLPTSPSTQPWRIPNRRQRRSPARAPNHPSLRRRRETYSLTSTVGMGVWKCG